jgi:CHAD domain-containing protein
MSVAPRCSNLLKTRLDRFTRMLPGVDKGDERALHRARVASRRLREIVPVLQLDAGVTEKLGRRLRKITRRLGDVRELDVMIALIDELRHAYPEHTDALTRVAAVATKGRDEARKDLAERLPHERLERMSRKLDHVVQTLRRGENDRADQRRPGRARSAAWAIDARVARRAERLREALTDSTAVYLPERLHDVRIAIKKLRYALELSGSLGRQDQAPALRTLKRAQEILGRMHDLQVLIDRVREVQASLMPPNLGVWRRMDALVVALDEMCRVLHARYLRVRPEIESVAHRLHAADAKALPRERQAG